MKKIFYHTSSKKLKKIIWTVVLAALAGTLGGASAFSVVGVSNHPDEDYRGYAAREPHFQGVGLITNGDDYATGTLIAKTIFATAGHVFQGVSPRDYPKFSCVFPGGQRTKIVEVAQSPKIDLAFVRLHPSIEGIEAPSILNISSDVLGTKLYQDTSSSPFERWAPTLHFSSAGYGRQGLWTTPADQLSPSDGILRACDLRPSFRVLERGKVRSSISNSIGLPLPGELTFGDSGAPLFMRDDKAKSPAWKIIGIAVQSGPSSEPGEDYTTVWQLFNEDMPGIKSILSVWKEEKARGGGGAAAMQGDGH